ncbi:MAG: N-acetylmuramoyl-L-alanine amidase [Bacillota bacterium]
MTVTVVVRNRVSIPVPVDSLGAWRAVCQALGHRLFWDEAGGTLHVDSHLDGWTVVLDPAHGGVDRTGRGPTGYVEADFVLDVALRAASEFSRVGARVALTREQDRTVPLPDRVRLARAGRACLFISLHTSPAAERSQVEVVYHVAGWPHACHLAGHLARWLGRQTQLPGHVRWCLLPGAEEGYGAVLWRAGALPLLGQRVRLAVLAYLGSHGDAVGESRLADPGFRQACAQGLLLGVLDFLMEYPLREREGFRLLVSARRFLDGHPTGAGLPDRAGPVDGLDVPGIPVSPFFAGLSSQSSAREGVTPASPEAEHGGELTAPPPAVLPAGGAAVRVPSGTVSAPGVPPRPGPPPLPRVVGGSVVVPGAPEGLVSPARFTASVRVPAFPPSSVPAHPSSQAGTGRGPTAPLGQVTVRPPFG